MESWQGEWENGRDGEKSRRYGGRIVTVLPESGAVWAKDSRMNTMVHKAESQAAGMEWADTRYAL